MDIQPSKDKVYQLQGDIRLVVGSTVIRHEIRAKLRLTMTEYVLLDFIHQWHQKKKEPITYGDYWKATAVKARMLNKKFQRLKDKGMLFKDTDGKVKTTAKWNSEFDAGEQFGILWKKMKTGNKQKAKAAFARALKVDSFENINKGLDKYLEFVGKIEWMSPQHLSTFLNHKNMEWASEFDPSQYEKKKTTNTYQEAPKPVTGPQSKL